MPDGVARREERRVGDRRSPTRAADFDFVAVLGVLGAAFVGVWRGEGRGEGRVEKIKAGYKVHRVSSPVRITGTCMRNVRATRKRGRRRVGVVLIV